MNETQTIEAETLAVATREPQPVSLFRTDDPSEVVVAITECGDRCCPLWHFRPYQRKP